MRAVDALHELSHFALHALHLYDFGLHKRHIAPPSLAPDLHLLALEEVDVSLAEHDFSLAHGEIKLVGYYPNYKTALAWYLDPEVCKQVDNRDEVYDMKLLKSMYRYLNERGELYYIKYKNRLCGDVCLHPDGEINIVVAKGFQNKHIGRRVIGEIVRLAREKDIPELYAEIYSFNTQSQRMFESVGFRRSDDGKYRLSLS